MLDTLDARSLWRKESSVDDFFENDRTLPTDLLQIPLEMHAREENDNIIKNTRCATNIKDSIIDKYGTPHQQYILIRNY